jgi:hypothetical protein
MATAPMAGRRPTSAFSGSRGVLHGPSRSPTATRKSEASRRGFAQYFDLDATLVRILWVESFAVQRSSNSCSTVTPASFRICRRVPGRTRL